MYSEPQLARALELHRQTGDALQIVLWFGPEPGRFVRDARWKPWRWDRAVDDGGYRAATVAMLRHAAGKLGYASEAAQAAVILDYRDNILLCKRCGVCEDVEFPMTVTDFKGKCDRFLEEHGGCLE